MGRVLRNSVLFGLALLALAGCEQSSFTLEGTISAASGTAVDSDTNDPAAPAVSNTFIGEEQPIPNPALVAGFVTASPTGNLARGDRFALQADPADGFRAALTQGQSVVLEISDWDLGNDLDLALYEPGGVDPVVWSVGVGDTESVTVPADGEYDIVVSAFAGTSNYVLSLSEAGVSGAAPSYGPHSEMVPGELVVRFREGVLPAGASATLHGRAASVGLVPKAGAAGRPMLMGLGEGSQHQAALDALGVAEPPLYRARGAPGDAALKLRLDTLFAMKALRHRPDVASADPNFIHRRSAAPADPLYGQQWHYPLINLPQAWDLTTGDQDVVVAVVDTGVFLAHEDLQGRLLLGYDFISSPFNALDGNGIDPDPDDPGDRCCAGSSSWHGTHVAGTVAASTNNARGVAGVSWETRIMPLRVLGAFGGTSYDIQQAIRYAAGLANDSGSVPARPADIINLSLGCQACYSSSDQAAYNAARSAGVIVIAAAGNESTSQPGYPASYAGVVSASAVNRLKQRAPYSNFGPTVDVSAPGGDQRSAVADGVLSTLVEEAASGSRRSAYAFYQGTSMAAPHVAGVAALMEAVYPALSPAVFDAALSGGAIVEDLGAAGRDDVYGYGLIDALKAVQYARQLASAGAVGALEATPEFLDFGISLTDIGLALTEAGADTVASVSVAEDADWLAVVPPASADGLGTYRVLVDRTGLAEGPYLATITFTADTGSALAVQARMRVGSAAGGSGDTGHIYVLLLDEAFTNAGQVDLDAVGGEYTYALDGVAPGTYFLLAGTDSDNDLVICDPGETCGAYPTLGVSTPIEVSSDLSGLDFVTTLASPVGGALAERDGDRGIPRRGPEVPTRQPAGP
ncbi:MAG: S8 family serine peptidase [Chromatiales bacterium]|jgi:serine protease